MDEVDNAISYIPNKDAPLRPHGGDDETDNPISYIPGEDMTKAPLRPQIENKGYRMLAIDGGGVRGIIPAMVIEELEAILNQYPKAVETVHLYELVDIIIGTSVGSIIGFGLGVKHFSGQECTNLIKKTTAEIFPDGILTTIKGLFAQILRQFTKYDNTILEEFLHKNFEDKTLESVTDGPITACTAYSVKQRRAVIFATADNGVQNSNVTIKDVILASTAAPTYFKPKYIQLHDGTQQQFVDGGITANCPVWLGYNLLKTKYNKVVLSEHKTNSDWLQIPAIPIYKLELVLSLGTGGESTQGTTEDGPENSEENSDGTTGQGWIPWMQNKIQEHVPKESNPKAGLGWLSEFYGLATQARETWKSMLPILENERRFGYFARINPDSEKISQISLDSHRIDDLMKLTTEWIQEKYIKKELKDTAVALISKNFYIEVDGTKLIPGQEVRFPIKQRKVLYDFTPEDFSVTPAYPASKPDLEKQTGGKQKVFMAEDPSIDFTIISDDQLYLKFTCPPRTFVLSVFLEIDGKTPVAHEYVGERNNFISGCPMLISPHELVTEDHNMLLRANPIP